MGNKGNGMRSGSGWELRKMGWWVRIEDEEWVGRGKSKRKERAEWK